MESGDRPLVGRAAELEAIDRALETTESGAFGCLALEGEPGIGKTRLLGELRGRADSRGHVTLHGIASEFEDDIPFAVIVDALDPYLRSRGEATAAELPTELLAELGPVFPALGAAAAPAPATTGDERYRTHRAIRSLLELLADAQPLTISLEDLHWADDASLELLQALLRRPPQAPVLIAVAARPGQAPARLTAALGAPGVELLSLTPLTRDEAAMLLAVEPSSGMLRGLYERAGGNPFYLEQLARGLKDGSAAGLPTGITASVAEELHGLDDDVRRYLQAAAVAGEPFEPDLAAEIAGHEDSGLELLDRLLDVDLVRPTDLPRRFIFRHPLVRQAAYESAPAGWRLAAHERAAAALAERGAGPGIRARHVEYAARPGDEQAIGVLLEAGEAAATRAPVAAARWFEAALRLLPTSDRARRIELLQRLARARRSAGRLEQSRAALLEALALVEDPGDPRGIELTAACAAVERWLGRGREARARLSEALAQLDPDQADARAALGVELTVDAVFERECARAHELGASALQAAERAGVPALRGAAAAALAMAEAGSGRIDAARAHRTVGCEVLDALSDDALATQLDALYHLAWAENYLEYYDSAIAHVDRLIGIIRRTEGARPLVPMMLVKCYPLETLGRLDEAAEICDAAVEATRLDDAGHFLPWALFERGWAHYYKGELAEANAAGMESMRISNRGIGGTGPSAGVGAAWVRGCALLQLGRPEAAYELLSAVAGDDIEGAMPVERGVFWETLALAAANSERSEEAWGYVARAEADAEEMPIAMPRGSALRARAALELAAGESARAAELAGEAATTFASIGARIEVAYSRAIQGEALAAAGSREEAVALLREAEAELGACGSLRERDAARRALRKLGARAEVRGPATGAEGGLEALTAREREIAELVTDRRTNREIAAELFLSEKTIESHLRNVFVKLGASSRVEVARILERSATSAERAAPPQA